jgi:hypothetical protein
MPTPSRPLSLAAKIALTVLVVALGCGLEMAAIQGVQPTPGLRKASIGLFLFFTCGFLRQSSTDAGCIILMSFLPLGLSALALPQLRVVLLVFASAVLLAFAASRFLRRIWHRDDTLATPASHPED